MLSRSYRVLAGLTLVVAGLLPSCAGDESDESGPVTEEPDSNRDDERGDEEIFLPSYCQSDKDCESDRPLCEVELGRCTECLVDGDCGDSVLCRTGACIPVTPCESSKQCGINEVCSEALGYCVECEGDNDCEADQVCVDSTCHLSCDSDIDCRESVCDGNLEICVECVSASDCADDQFCDQGNCRAEICSPNAAQCAGATLVTCNDVGSGFITADCSAGCSDTGVACADASSCNRGDDGCTCYPNDTCNGSLECSDGVCLDPDLTGGGTGGHSGTGGAGTGGAGTGGAGTGGAPLDCDPDNPGPSPSGGRSLGGFCYPICASATTDDDWGWEQNASCVVRYSDSYYDGVACSQPGTCSHTPVTPGASLQARKLLCYLHAIYKNGVLSGQQETSWESPESDVSWYCEKVGKVPAVLGGDFLYPTGTTDRAIAYWKAGGVPMIRYHMGAPPFADTYENSLRSVDFDKLFTPGTDEYDSFFEKLNYAADELEKMEDAGVAVIWAPFHEIQVGGWFWWAKGTTSDFLQLWNWMHYHMTVSRGLKNLIFLMPFSHNPYRYHLPPKSEYDLAGPDSYESPSTFDSLYSTTRSIVGSTTPIPLHETGTVPLPSDMFSGTTPSSPWLLWNIWAHGYQKDPAKNPLWRIEEAYASDYTVTRDEVPYLQ